MDTKSIIVNNIIYLRKKKGLTQQDVADELNYSDKTISKWERGESLPDAETMLRVATLFEVDVNYLYEEHEFQKISLFEEQKLLSKEKRVKIVFVLMILGIVVVLTGILFASLSEVIPNMNQFRFYFLAIPTIAIALFIINLIVGRKKYNRLLLSLVVWSFGIALYLSLYSYNLLIIFSIAIVIQVGIFLFPKVGKSKNTSKK